MSKGFTNDAIPALSVCESPIEGKFVQAWISTMTGLGMRPMYSVQERCKLCAEFGSDGGVVWMLLIQPKPKFLEPLRLDFMVVHIRGSDSVSFGVEVDGAQFHASQEQQLRDRTKDRLCLVNDVPVIRFCGTEIYRSAGECAEFVCGAAVIRMRKLKEEQQFCFDVTKACGHNTNLYQSALDSYIDFGVDSATVETSTGEL